MTQKNTSHDERFYPRLSTSVFTNTLQGVDIKCPQAVLNQFKPIKTPAVFDEQGVETSSIVYYTEADDGLSIQDACVAANIPTVYLIESETNGVKNVPVQTDDITEATNVLLVLPPLKPSALIPFFTLATTIGANVDQALLYAESSYKTYLATGQLPE